MLERDDFTKRLQGRHADLPARVPVPADAGARLVEIRADVELGGTEQLFNLMVGRDLQRDAGQEPQICLTLPILRGLDGEKKMGKSLGNYIGVDEPAKEQFGKTMSIPDDLMREWFTLLTDRPAAEIDATRRRAPDRGEEDARGGRSSPSTTARTRPTAARADWEKQFADKAGPGQHRRGDDPGGEAEGRGDAGGRC